MSKKTLKTAAKAQKSGKPNSIGSSAQDADTTSQPADAAFESLRNKIQAQLTTLDRKKHKVTSKSEEKQEKEDVTGRGKKRDRSGAVLEAVKNKATQPKHNPDTDDHVDDGSDDELQNAMRDLGGTNEDMDLIAGADSESEMEGIEENEIEAQKPEVKKPKSIQAGISNILKEIALAKGKYKIDEGDEGEEDAEEALLENHKPAPMVKTVTPPELPAKKSRKSDRSGLKCQPRPDWFSIVQSHTQDIDAAAKPVSSQFGLEPLHSYAWDLLEAENEAFKLSQQSSSSQAFYNTVIASGTLSDKISALTLAVQESPLHNVKALENLIGLAKKRSRTQAVDVLRALKDLFAQGSLLPGDRRLFHFASNPTLLAMIGKFKSWKTGDQLPKGIKDEHLICWAYENWLKDQYFEVLKILEVWCSDELEFAKSRALSYVYELLKEKPEQESNLLRLLVNKLGDPVKKIASQASFLLMQLLQAHPAMKLVVISAIESDFIFRPGQSMHGKYYAVVTINQTTLSANEEDLAKKLLNIYFGLFKALLKLGNDKVPEASTELQSKTRGERQRQQKKKNKETESVEPQEEELRERLTSAILTGVNRAYPYSGSDYKSFTEHIETLFKITHSANFNTSIQSMMLIQQLTATHQASSDHFYRTLYESLLDPRLVTSSKQQLYLNLLHRSLKADLNSKRVKAFVKRILQILSLHEASFTCGAFFLLKDLEKTFPSLVGLIDQTEDHDDDEEVFRDVDEDAPPSATNAPSKDSAAVTYDASKRAPEHANADNSCAWEIIPFLAHFHPSVSISADHMLEHTKLPGKPDLSLHTLIHFLDRFVYKNAKLSSTRLRGSSLMQPMASDDAHAVLISSVTSGRGQPAVNSEEFRVKDDEDVSAEDVFFHKYFKSVGKTSAKKSKLKTSGKDEDGGDESEEDEIWKAMVDSAPDLEGLEDDEDDVDLSDTSDFEAAMDDSEDLEEDDQVNDDGSEVDIEAGIFDDSNEDMLDSPAQVEGYESKQNSDGSDFAGLDSGPEEDAKATSLVNKKKQRQEGKEQKKKMRALPTFASAADYAKMLEDDDDEDLG